MSAISLAFKALSDPTRRDILQLLKKHDMTPSELGIHFPIAGPSLSHHLSVLKQANLITADKQGQNIIYAINTTVFYDILNGFMKTFE